MTFTISNLKTGDLVICANGKMATVMKDTAREDVLRFHTEFNSFSRLGVNYNSDMTNKRADGLTIVKVYRAIGVASNKIGDLVFNPLKMLEYGTVVYDRATAEANGDDITIDSLKQVICLFIETARGLQYLRAQSSAILLDIIQLITALHGFPSLTMTP